MPSRVLAFFLAFVLFWSGLSTIEGTDAWAQQAPAQHHPLVQPGALADLADGSVEDHHLDDLPSQAQGDPPAETPDLLPVPTQPPSASVATGQGHVLVSAAAGPPFLARPMRPPCVDARAG